MNNSPANGTGVGRESICDRLQRVWLRALAAAVVVGAGVGASAQPTLYVNMPARTVVEGTDASYKVCQSNSQADALTVNVSVTETGDMVADPAPTTFEFEAGASGTARCMEVAVATDDDAVDEDDSRVTLTILPGDGYTLSLFGEKSGTVTVTDNDEGGVTPPPLPTVTIAAGTSPVTEGSGGRVHLEPHRGHHGGADRDGRRDRDGERPSPVRRPPARPLTRARRVRR